MRAARTADTIRVIKELTDKIGKVGVSVKDGPGFLVNRVNAALRNEVYNCLAEGVATIEDIDKALKFGLGHPMGPFELGDFVGLEIGLAVAETLWDNFKDPKWRPSLLLKKLVEIGPLVPHGVPHHHQVDVLALQAPGGLGPGIAGGGRHHQVAKPLGHGPVHQLQAGRSVLRTHASEIPHLSLNHQLTSWIF